MDTKKVDVMVADASHEVYVDKILDTIREAAKVRGTGIAERTHEYVATKMKEGELGKQTICCDFRFDCASRLSRYWIG